MDLIFELILQRIDINGERIAALSRWQLRLIRRF